MSQDKIWTDQRRNPFMWITGEPSIGEDCWIGPFAVLDGAYGLEIGDRCSIAAGAQIYSHGMTRPGREAGEMETAQTTVGDDVYIGANAVICHGCEIGDGSTIVAGTVVSSGTSVPKGATWAGVPARPLEATE